MANNDFVNPSIFLFLDQLLVAAGGWIYWLLISQISSTSEIGQATTVFSLVILTAGLTQLGLEYPLLKKAVLNKARILGTALVIEVLITVASIPVILLVMNFAYQESLRVFSFITIVMLVLSSLGFIPRYSLLGISDAKTILIVDIFGVVAKFAIGYTLVLLGFGAYGMLLSFLAHGIIVTGVTILVAIKKFGLSMGDKNYVKEIIKEGLVNTPSKLSRMLILSLSIVLLATFGVTSADVGVFYMALMISIVGGGLASSMAFMVIPASTSSNRDLSMGSLRIGLSLTSPLIAVLITAPSSILYIIGPDYVEADVILIILSIAILPSSIVMNAISKFNNTENFRRLITIGMTEILVFLIVFWVIVPTYGVAGAAYSILAAFVSSSILSVIWFEKISLRYIGISGLAIVSGWICGYLATMALNQPIVSIVCSILVSLSIVIKLKNTSTGELSQIVKTIIQRHV